MKKLTRLLLALTLALVSPAALAAEETSPAGQAPVISVQLDGAPLTFPDAVPQVKDQRTFLPFRAVFEAMGAQVSSQADAITAVRGDTTLTMRLGEAEATVTRDGAETSLTMDVAPYVDPETWRTYVPVRFAAQAFGCLVGWDQESSTVLLVDTGKLISAAMEGKEFTCLEKLVAYSGKYRRGLWDLSLDMDGTVTIFGAPLFLQGTLSGIIEDTEKYEIEANLKEDISEFVTVIAAFIDEPIENFYTEENLVLMEALQNNGTDIFVRIDFPAKTLCYHAGSSHPAIANTMTDDWIYMNIDSFYSYLPTPQDGLLKSLPHLAEPFRTTAPAALAQFMLSQLTPTSASEESPVLSYGAVKQTVEALALALSDAGFTKEGNSCTTLLESGPTKLSLTLTMKEDQVTAHTMDLSTVRTFGEYPTDIAIALSMDENGQMELSGTLNATITGADQSMTLLGAEVDLSGGYTPGRTAPVTEPPADAEIRNLLRPTDPQTEETPS